MVFGEDLFELPGEPSGFGAECGTVGDEFFGLVEESVCFFGGDRSGDLGHVRRRL